MSHPQSTTRPASGPATPEGERARLELLPHSYRSWVSGALRVFVALTLTVAAGLLLRSFPEGQANASAATREASVRARALTAATTSPRPAVPADAGSPALASTRTSSRAAAAAAAVVPAVPLPALPFPVSPPDLRLRLLSPTGAATAVSGRPVVLRAQVSDVTGGIPADADLVWKVTRADGRGGVLFVAHGADAELPAGAAVPGRYRVTVVARSGIARAEASATLVIAPRTR